MTGSELDVDKIIMKLTSKEGKFMCALRNIVNILFLSSGKQKMQKHTPQRIGHQNAVFEGHEHFSISADVA